MKDAKEAIREMREKRAKANGDEPLYPGDRARDSFGRRSMGMRIQDLMDVLIRYHPETRLFVGFEGRKTDPLDHLEDVTVEEAGLSVRGILLVAKE